MSRSEPKASSITSRSSKADAVLLCNLLAKWKLNADSSESWFNIVACKKLAKTGQEMEKYVRKAAKKAAKKVKVRKRVCGVQGGAKS